MSRNSPPWRRRGGPAKPQAMKSPYDSVFAKGLPSMIYSAEDDHVVYKLTVIDLTNTSPFSLTMLR